MTLLYASPLIEFDITAIASDPIISGWLSDDEISHVFYQDGEKVYLRIPVEYEDESLNVEPIIQSNNYIAGSKIAKFTATAINTGIFEGKGTCYCEVYAYVLILLKKTQSKHNPAIAIDYADALLAKQNYVRNINEMRFPGVMREGYIINISQGTPVPAADTIAGVVSQFGGKGNGVSFTFQEKP